MSKRLSGWMPWSDFTRIGHEIREQSDGIAIPVCGLVLATVIASTALPRLSLLISIVGGLLIVSVVALATGQYRELVDGFTEVGGLPTGMALARLLCQLTLTDLRRLWHGSRHSEQLRSMQQTTALHRSEYQVRAGREGVEA